MAGRKKRIGEILLQSGLIDEKQLGEGLRRQQAWSKKLGETLVGLGFLTEQHLAKILGDLSNLPAVDLKKLELSKSATTLIPFEFCEANLLVPVNFKTIEGRNYLIVAFVDPMNLNVIDELRFIVNIPILRVVATKEGVEYALKKQYPKRKKSKTPRGWTEVSLSGSIDPNESVMEVYRHGGSLEEISFSRNVASEGQKTETLKESSPIGKVLKTLIKVLMQKGVLTREEAQRLVALLSK